MAAARMLQVCGLFGTSVGVGLGVADGGDAVAVADGDAVDVGVEVGIAEGVAAPALSG